MRIARGINIRFDARKAARGERPWVVFVETVIGDEEIRKAPCFAAEDDAVREGQRFAAALARMRAEADEDAQRRKALAVPELPSAPNGVTLFETIAQRWLEEHVRPMLESATYRSYAGDLQRHLLPIMRTWPMTNEVMTPQRLKDVLKRQLFDKGLSLPSRLSCHGCLSALFGWALGELPPGQLTWNPLLKQARYVRQETEKKVKLKQPPNPMTAVQAEAFLAWQKQHHPELYEWFLWLIETGSRISEASAVQWPVVDLDRGRAHIIAAYSTSERWAELQRGDTDGLGEKDTKTHREDQYIDLSDRLVEALRKLKVANLEQWMARGRPGKEPQHVFLTRRLTPRRPDNIVYEAFHDGCTALQLVGQTGKPFTIHCLRDTFATLAILGGKHIGWVSMMLGHADEQTTRKHYYKWVRLVDDNPLAAKQAREEE